MKNETNDLVAQFLAQGGKVRTFASTHETGRRGDLLEIREIPVGNAFRSLGAFRLRVHFADINTEANVACTLQLREGLEAGKSYMFPTETIQPQRKEKLVRDKNGNVRGSYYLPLKPRTTALKLTGPAIEI